MSNMVLEKPHDESLASVYTEKKHLYLLERRRLVNIAHQLALGDIIGIRIVQLNERVPHGET